MNREENYFRRVTGAQRELGESFVLKHTFYKSPGALISIKLCPYGHCFCDKVCVFFIEKCAYGRIKYMPHFHCLYIEDAQADFSLRFASMRYYFFHYMSDNQKQGTAP